MTVVLGLRQRNVELLRDLFSRVSDPTREEYGQHMRGEEVRISLGSTEL